MSHTKILDLPSVNELGVLFDASDYTERRVKNEVIDFLRLLQSYGLSEIDSLHLYRNEIIQDEIDTPIEYLDDDHRAKLSQLLEIAQNSSYLPKIEAYIKTQVRESSAIWHQI